MEQFSFVPVSLYNKSFSTQSVTKLKLPKCQSDQKAVYQFYLLRGENNKKLFAEAETLVDKIFSCPCIKLSNSQTLILDGVETGRLLSDIAQQLRRKNGNVLDIYLTPLVNLRLWFWIRLPKRKREEAGFRTSQAAKAVHTGWCCWWVCAQLRES